MIQSRPDGAEGWMASFRKDQGRDLALHSVLGWTLVVRLRLLLASLPARSDQRKRRTLAGALAPESWSGLRRHP